MPRSLRWFLFCRVTPTEALAPSLGQGYNIMVFGPGTVSLQFNPQVLHRAAWGGLLPVITHMLVPLFELRDCLPSDNSLYAGEGLRKACVLFCIPAR